MFGDKMDDEYVARLLKQDAKSTVKKYEMVGLDAFLPQRARNGAPKPNTNFLRHIIRQTDSHNAALLAKEAEDSHARLREMNRERAIELRMNKCKQGAQERNSNRGVGRFTPPTLPHEHSEDKKRKRSCHSDDDDEKKIRRRHHHGQSKDPRPNRDGEQGRDTRKERGTQEESDNDRSRRRSRHSKHSHDHERRHKNDSDEDHHRSRRKVESGRSYRRRRSRSRSASRSNLPTSRSQRHYKSDSRLHESRSRAHDTKNPERYRSSAKITNEARHSKSSSPSLNSDSDPLEAIFGPLPPRAQPAIRSRGRGAYKASSNAMDSRFSTTYNPSTDVHINSDIEDDWGDALEALKDRQRWKQQGAERLKAAGFSDEQVKKWEKGDEKTDEDVKWAKRGEGREWDRGKVVDDEGDVDLKADWGRLK